MDIELKQAAHDSGDGLTSDYFLVLTLSVQFI